MTPTRQRSCRLPLDNYISSVQKTLSREQASACILAATFELTDPSFKDAAASIRRTTTAYNYQLVIQRAYEEGEEQLSESDDGDLNDGT